MNDGCGCCVDPAYQYDGKCECACHDGGVTVTCACPHGGGHNDYSSQACSWEQWIAGRPPDHPKRLRHEAGDNTLDWEDWNYNGEPCRCACHDDEDW